MKQNSLVYLRVVNVIVSVNLLKVPPLQLIQSIAVSLAIPVRHPIISPEPIPDCKGLFQSAILGLISSSMIQFARHFCLKV